MKVKIKVRKRYRSWGVNLVVGNQSFWLDFYGPWAEARWMAGMLKIALTNAGASVNLYKKCK
jgi:hypothetical protein